MTAPTEAGAGVSAMVSMTHKTSFKRHDFNDGDVCYTHYMPSTGRITVVDRMMSQTTTPSARDQWRETRRQERMNAPHYTFVAIDNPSGADVLAAIDGMAVEAYRFRLAQGTESPEASAIDSQARTAVAALIARNAELEAERDAANARGDRWSVTAQEIDLDLQKMTAERVALAAENKVLRLNAERYLWLRHQTGGQVVSNGTEFRFPNYSTLPANLPDLPWQGNVGPYLDAAIDLARTPAATTKGNDND